jgi:predicted dehydrogenase
LRFGVVGTAFWASEVHVPGLLAAAGVELVGVWGRSVDKARAIANRHGIHAFESLDAMLSAVDAITIAVPPDAQVEIALRASAAGKHLILEKPIATNAAAAQRIVDALDRGGLASLVFFIRRFIPEVAAAIAVAEGGEWDRAEVRVLSAALDPGSPYRGSTWRQAEDAGLWDIGPHALSVLLPILGPVVAAERLPTEPGYIRFGTAHQDGRSADIRVTLRAAASEAGSDYRFFGKAGTATLPDPAFSRPEVFTLAARDLVAMIESGEREHPCDVRLGLETVRILAGIEAAEKQQAMPGRGAPS